MLDGKKTNKQSNKKTKATVCAPSVEGNESNHKVNAAPRPLWYQWILPELEWFFLEWTQLKKQNNFLHIKKNNNNSKCPCGAVWKCVCVRTWLCLLMMEERCVCVCVGGLWGSLFNPLLQGAVWGGGGDVFGETSTATWARNWWRPAAGRGRRWPRSPAAAGRWRRPPSGQSRGSAARWCSCDEAEREKRRCHLSLSLILSLSPVDVLLRLLDGLNGTLKFAEVRPFFPQPAAVFALVSWGGRERVKPRSDLGARCSGTKLNAAVQRHVHCCVQPHASRFNKRGSVCVRVYVHLQSEVRIHCVSFLEYWHSSVILKALKLHLNTQTMTNETINRKITKICFVHKFFKIGTFNTKIFRVNYWCRQYPMPSKNIKMHLTMKSQEWHNDILRQYTMRLNTLINIKNVFVYMCVCTQIHPVPWLYT